MPIKTLDDHKDRLLEKYEAWNESENKDEVQYCFPSVYQKEQFEREYAALEKAFEYFCAHPEHIENMMNEVANSVEPTGSDFFRPELWKGIHWCWLFGI